MNCKQRKGVVEQRRMAKNSKRRLCRLFNQDHNPNQRWLFYVAFKRLNWKLPWGGKVSEEEKEQFPPCLAFDLSGLSAVEAVLNEWLPLGFVFVRLDIIHSEFFCSYKLILLRRDYAFVSGFDTELNRLQAQEHYSAMRQQTTNQFSGGGKDEC